MTETIFKIVVTKDDFAFDLQCSAATWKEIKRNYYLFEDK